MHASRNGSPSRRIEWVSLSACLSRYSSRLSRVDVWRRSARRSHPGAATANPYCSLGATPSLNECVWREWSCGSVADREPTSKICAICDSSWANGPRAPIRSQHDVRSCFAPTERKSGSIALRIEGLDPVHRAVGIVSPCRLAHHAWSGYGDLSLTDGPGPDRGTPQPRAVGCVSGDGEGVCTRRPVSADGISVPVGRQDRSGQVRGLAYEGTSSRHPDPVHKAVGLGNPTSLKRTRPYDYEPAVAGGVESGDGLRKGRPPRRRCAHLKRAAPVDPDHRTHLLLPTRKVDDLAAADHYGRSYRGDSAGLRA